MKKEIDLAAAEHPVITAENLLEHWQGHRSLTRKVIASFPEDKLFTYSVGGMRPFSELAMEMVGMAGPGLNGIITKEWKAPKELDHHAHAKPSTKEELLRIWDEVTDYLNANWSRIPAARFQEVDRAFGQWDGVIYWTLFYFIDNEIHHRGQGYVYLRSLDIAPPPFWERN